MKKYDIYINGCIGWPFSAEYVRQELERFDGQHVDVLISSLGGSVLHALQIRQLFVDHGDVTVHLHGFVASAATIIAMGAREIRIGKYALMLVHRCSNWVETWGQMNAEEIAQTIRQLSHDQEDLETIDHVVACIYADRCKKTVEECADLMKGERWMTADECVAFGLADSIEPDDVQPSDVDDSTVAGLSACGYPLPDFSARPQKTGIVEAITQALRNIFGPKIDVRQQPTAVTNAEVKPAQPAEPQDAAEEHPAAQQDAAEAQPAGASEDEPTASAAITDREAELTREVEELRAQLAALQAADGADTTDTEGDTFDAVDEDHTIAARRNFERLKGLL